MHYWISVNCLVAFGVKLSKDTLARFEGLAEKVLCSGRY